MTELLRFPRIFTQHRAFSVCVILSLGVGISTSAGVIAIADSIKRGRLPFLNADRLEHLYVTNRSGRERRFDVSGDVVRALSGPNSPVQAVATYRHATMKIRDREQVHDTWGAIVSWNFPTILTARMTLGRAFDSTAADNAPSVILAHRFWRTRMGSDSSIVGRSLEINGGPYEVVGVAAPQWEFPERVSLWASDPAPMTTLGRPHDVSAVAMLRPGTEPALARPIIATLGTAAVTFERGRRFDRVESHSLRDQLTFFGLRGAIIFLTLIAAFVAFLTAVNFAGLLLARGIRRRGELGTRAALGASVTRLAAHVINESLLLCAAGGILAALLAPYAVEFLRSSFENMFPAWLEISLSWRTVALSIGLTLAIGVVFGLGPALDLARPALATFLRSTGSSASGTKGLARSRAVLVSFQIALATAVLVLLGATLGGSLMLSRPAVGFPHEQIIVASLGAESDSQAAGARARAALYRLRQVSGVVTGAMLESRYIDRSAVVIDGEESTGGFNWIQWVRTGEDFFSVMRPRLVDGRFPVPEEQLNGAPVAVITQTMAKRLFDNQALGRRMRIGGPQFRIPAIEVTVIGVVGDVQRHAYQLEPTATLFTPHGSGRPVSSRAQQELWLRTDAPVSSALVEMHRLAATDPVVFPVQSIQSLAEVMRFELRTLHRVARIVFGIFAIALGLAALGIYGLVAYTAEMRSREMAIREALGGSRLHVTGLMLRGALIQTLAGVAVGSVIASIGITRMPTSEFQIDLPTTTIAIALVIMAATVLLSSIGPLREAWKRDLSYVLRV